MRERPGGCCQLPATRKKNGVGISSNQRMSAGNRGAAFTCTEEPRTGPLEKIYVIPVGLTKNYVLLGLTKNYVLLGLSKKCAMYLRHPFASASETPSLKSEKRLCYFTGNICLCARCRCWSHCARSSCTSSVSPPSSRKSAGSTSAPMRVATAAQIPSLWSPSTCASSSSCSPAVDPAS